MNNFNPAIQHILCLWIKLWLDIGLLNLFPDFTVDTEEKFRVWLLSMYSPFK